MTNNEKKVLNWIEKNSNVVIELLSQLIQVPSVTTYFDEDPKFMCEGEAQRKLKSYLEELGLITEFSFPDADALKKYENKVDSHIYIIFMYLSYHFFYRTQAIINRLLSRQFL